MNNQQIFYNIIGTVIFILFVSLAYVKGTLNGMDRTKKLYDELLVDMKKIDEHFHEKQLKIISNIIMERENIRALKQESIESFLDYNPKEDII